MDIRKIRAGEMLVGQGLDEIREAFRPEPHDDGALQRLYEATCRGQTSRHTIAYRDLTVASAPGGGYLTQPVTLDALNPLPPEAVARQAGVRVETLPVPSGAPIQPVWSDALINFEWLATEASTLTNQTPALGAVATSLKHGGVAVKIGYQLNRQSNAIQTLRNLLRFLARIGVDQAFLAGSGASGEVLGVLNTAGINAQSGTNLAWAGVCAMEEAVTLKNASDAALVWVAHPDVRKLLRQREQIANGGRPIWDGSQIAGHRAMVSTNVPSGTLLVGDFSNVTIVLWGGIEVLVNPFATNAFKEGAVELGVFLAMDVVVNYPFAFCKSETIT